MLYFTTKEGQHIVILEPENIEAIKAKKYAITADNNIAIAYTPDAEWLTEQLVANASNLDPTKLDQLIKESQTRPENQRRAVHPTLHIIKDGKPPES